MNSPLSIIWEATKHMFNTFISRLPSLAVAALVFIAFYVLSVFVDRMIRRVVSKRRYNLAVLFSRLAGGATIFLGLLVSFSVVAPSFQASDLIKILGIGGVAIGFAFQNILQNFLAGLLLLWSEPFRVGDEIRIDPYEGSVEEIQARATIIKTYDERRVVIPNADLFTHAVIVNTALKTRRWEYVLSVKNVHELEKLKPAIIQAVRSVPDVLQDPAPEAFVMDIDPAADTGKVRVLWWTSDTRQHEMLASYDRALTAIIGAIGDFSAGLGQAKAA
jgi:small conductance mechanosensitive channel